MQQVKSNNRKSYFSIGQGLFEVLAQKSSLITSSKQSLSTLLSQISFLVVDFKLLPGKTHLVLNLSQISHRGEAELRNFCDTIKTFHYN